MKKYLNMVLLAITCFFTVGQAMASDNGACWVTLDGNDRIAFYTLRHEIERVMWNQSGGSTETSYDNKNCKIDYSGSAYADRDVAERQIIFMTTESGTHNTPVKTITMAYAQDENGLPTQMRFKTSKKWVIGNYSNEAIKDPAASEVGYTESNYGVDENGTIKDFGFVVIDASGFPAGTSPFLCEEGTTGTIYLRDLVFQGNMSEDEFFAHADNFCFKNGGDVHFCNGTLLKDADDNYIDPNSGLAWCSTDECEMVSWFKDADGDTYGDLNNSTTACEQPTGYVLSPDDCNDADAAINPGANEICDTLDNDCDELVDSADADVQGATAYYTDADVDTFGDSTTQKMLCTGDDTTSLVTDATDCNDADATINPIATEVCGDSIDQNCNGDSDDTCVVVDADVDGYDTTTDCNDGDATINPGATEVCDSADNNCDGAVDEGDVCGTECESGVYDDSGACVVSDADSDGFTTEAGDCNDSDASINPDATETCGDAVDNNCNDTADEGCTDEVCDDGIDNNLDGLTDCDDTDCAASFYLCNGVGPEETCDDTIDNDGDSLADCEDKDCMFETTCLGSESICDDGTDNDLDGLSDCDDPDCTDFVIDAEGTTCASAQITPIGSDNFLQGGGGCSCNLGASNGPTAANLAPIVAGMLLIAIAGLLRKRAAQK